MQLQIMTGDYDELDRKSHNINYKMESEQGS